MKCCLRVLIRPLLSLLILLPVSSEAKRRVLDRSVVTVNDDIILESDIEAFKQKTKSKNFKDLFGGVDPSKLDNRESILQLLIEEKIIDQQVKRLELNVTDAEVDRHIRLILERNGITESQLKTRLKDLGTSYAEYRDGIRRQLERRNLVEREIKPMMEVSDEELRHFLLRKGEDTGYRYELAHILIGTKGKKGEERANHILKEAVAHPEEFAKLAAEYSDDSSSAQSGGDLGVFSIDAMVKEFREAARKTAPGKVYPQLLRTAGGIHIIKIVASRPVTFADLPDEKKSELRNEMMAAELEKKMALWLDRKKNEAHIRRSSLDLAQKKPKTGEKIESGAKSGG